MTGRLILVATLVICLALGLVFWLFESVDQQAVVVNAPIVEPASKPRDVILYFVGADGDSLTVENRSLAGCDEDIACMHQIVKTIIAGPGDGNLPVFSPDIRLLNLDVEEDLAKVDFSKNILQKPSSGSLTELLSIYALIDSLVVNFPYVRRVQVLVDGRQVPTLHGHVDLRHPLSADFEYAQVRPLDGPAKELMPSFEEQEIEVESQGGGLPGE